MKSIKNYTSGVPVSTTIARIEQCIAEAGANGIMKEISDGRVTAICFRIQLPDGMLATVRLPAKVQGAYQQLRQLVRRPNRGTEQRLQDQALRTAWKLVQDWVEIQMSMVKMGQADFREVFLSYFWDGQQTYYDMLSTGKFKALPAPFTSEARA